MGHVQIYCGLPSDIWMSVEIVESTDMEGKTLYYMVLGQQIGILER